MIRDTNLSRVVISDFCGLLLSDFGGRSIADIIFEGQTLWVVGIYAATIANKQLLIGGF